MNRTGTAGLALVAHVGYAHAQTKAVTDLMTPGLLSLGLFNPPSLYYAIVP